MKLLGDLLKDEEEAEIDNSQPSQVDSSKKIEKKDLFIAGVFFLAALVVRLFFLFTHNSQSAGLAWYGDVYHHWQIGYLSLTTGFNEGFLRLWDLKGMEFFWGLLHPLVLASLFKITGSVDILVPRILAIVCGAMVISLIYLILKRSLNRWVAIAVGIWGTFFSVVLFSDTLGMQEQLGLFLLLGGILVWPKGWLSGLLWALASMVRSEYWMFATALVFVSLFDKRANTSGAKVSVIVSYLLPILAYMKYMLAYTNNAIFPIAWNFRASVVGEWFTNVDDPLTEVQIMGQWFGRALFATGLVGSLITFWKRFKDYQLFMLGFFNVAFIGYVFGFGAYIHGFFERFWVDRLLAFPYLFLGILVTVFFLHVLPSMFSRIKYLFYFLGISIVLVMTTASQLAWAPIMHYFQIAQAPYAQELNYAAKVAENDPKEGKILFPPDRPALTYALVRNHGVNGNRFLSDMYDPYFYATGEETQEELDKKELNWLTKEKVRLIVFTGKETLNGLFQRYPEKFRLIDTYSGMTFYEFLR